MHRQPRTSTTTSTRSRARSRHFRRTRLVGASGLLALAALAVLPMPGSRADSYPAPSPAVEPGQGSAIAQTWKIDPKAAGLSIGITFGQALAGHQNTVAKAASQAINLGVVGTTLGAEPCDPNDEPTWPREDQPQPLMIDSREEGAAEGKTEYENSVSGWQSPAGYGPWKKQVRASDTPLGESVTTTAPIGFDGVLEIGAGVARSTSGVVNGVRLAQSIVDISHVNLANVVKLGGIRWEATYRSSGDSGVTGRFTIGHAEIAGTSSPTNDPSKALGEANKALAPFGLKLTPPTAYEAGGVLFVQPLTIGVVPNAERDRVAGSVLAGVHPIREPLFQAFIDYECDSADLITVFDIVLGSMTGAGEFAIELGGVQATSGIIPETGYNLDPGSLVFDTGTPAIPGSDPVFTPGITTAGGTAYTGTATPTPRAATTRPTAPRPRVATNNFAPAAAFTGTRGGAMAGVALATLALLALFAEGDRRRMRRAQHEILSTEE